MSWQRSHKPPKGTLTRQNISHIRHSTNKHSNSQLKNINTRIHTHAYNNIQGIQTVPNRDISNYFMHKYVNSLRRTTPLSLQEGNTLYTNKDTHAPPPTNNIQNGTRLPPCSEGVVRFVRINKGGVCSKQYFAEFKLLLTNINMS